MQIANRKSPAGFSFTEILFAVMILGIGFIMVAAMFPVALSQTQSNSRETVAAAVARAGTTYLARIATTPWIIPVQTNPNTNPLGELPTTIFIPTFPLTTRLPGAVGIPFGQTQVNVPGQVWSFYDVDAPSNSAPRDQYRGYAKSADHGPLLHRDFLWNTVAGNLVNHDDPRFAWVGMYKRDYIAQQVGTGAEVTQTFTPAAYAQVIVIAVQAGARPAFDDISRSNDITHAGTLIATLQPARFSQVTITPPATPDGPSFITFDPASQGIGRVAEGAYAVVSDTTEQRFSNLTDPLSLARRNLILGRIFRMGVQQPTAANPYIFQLRPGDDLSRNDVQALGSAPFKVDVMVVGRGYADLNNPKAGYAGPAQDITAYTTFVQIPN